MFLVKLSRSTGHQKQLLARVGLGDLDEPLHEPLAVIHVGDDDIFNDAGVGHHHALSHTHRQRPHPIFGVKTPGQRIGVRRSIIQKQMTDHGKYRFRMIGLLVFCLRYVCPTAIFLIFLNSIGIL